MATPTKDKLWNRNYLKLLSTNFLLYFAFMLLAPLLPLYLSDTFHASKDSIGLVLSGYTITALCIRMFSGYLVDTFPRKLVLLLSYDVFALFFLGYVFAGTLLLFTLVRTLHGAPFGVTTVATSTAAIDVLPSSRRAEGIGYYGLSNNIATAISPTLALFLFSFYGSYNALFLLAFILSLVGFFVNASVDIPKRSPVKKKMPISLDRFILLRGWSQGLTMVCFSFSYGVVSTYIAIYGRDELGITNGTGVFFALLAIGLILSRLTGSKSLRQGKIVRNATEGILLSLVGYLVFAAMHNQWGYYGAALIIGLGNGHMYPAFQNMFINLATHDQRGTANSTLLVSWDMGVGIGILAGGILSHNFSFHTAFWAAWAVNLCGAIFFLLYSRLSFLRNRLR
ncbi:MAG: MFS transporter [Prevotellaceae bacterium]|nr:MFS transporter [Prevotellaceae bacterium]